MGFQHRTLGQRVILDAGHGAAHVLAELDRLDAGPVMVIGGEREEQFIATLARRTALRWADVVQHVPTELADRAGRAAIEAGIDVVVAIGGGSAIGLAKAIALRHPVRIIAVPTTYAGSEATDVWGLTDAGGKRTGVDDRVLPATVVYDAELTASMPLELAAASGLNAVAHCIDTLWAPRADPINRALATEALRALSLGLTSAPDDCAAREQTQYGAYLAAVAFASAGSALHHKICHVLGGRFDLPHAGTHAIVLPYVLGWNVPAAPDAAERIATAFSASDAVTGLDRLRTRLGAPRALRDIGLREQDLDAATQAVLRVIPPSNPRPLDEPAVNRLLRAAWAGEDAVTFAEQARA